MNKVTSYLAMIGRKGGKRRSAAKTKAARANARKRWSKRLKKGNRP